MHKGKYVESFDVWKRIRGTDLPENREEFFIMKHSLLEESTNPSRRKRFVWLDFVTVPRARRSIIYATIMIFLGQFTGINAIMYYMATLMNKAGFDSKQSVFMSLVGGGSLLLGTLPAIFYMERHQVPAKVMADLMVAGSPKIGHDFCRHLVTLRTPLLGLRDVTWLLLWTHPHR